jgi:hypothetical protein
MKYSNLRSFQTFIEAWFAREVVEAISMAEDQAQREAIKNGLADVTPEVLVRAVFSLDTSEEAVAEAEHRLGKTPLANQFAFRVLVGWRKQEARTLRPKDAADLDDAVDGLCRCCFTAIGDWSAPGDSPTWIYAKGMDRLVRTDRRETAAFMNYRLSIILSEYRELPDQTLLCMALHGDFKDFPAEMRCDFIDEMRKQTTRKAQGGKCDSYGVDLASVEGHTQTPPPDSRPDAGQAIQLIRIHEDGLIEELGESNYATLKAVADYWENDHVPDAKQKRKSGLTAAIARRLRKSPRQGRERKKRLHAGTVEAQRSGNIIVKTLYELLAGPPVAPDANVELAETKEPGAEDVADAPTESVVHESEFEGEDFAVFAEKDEEE